jgi:hypothetical protein
MNLTSCRVQVRFIKSKISKVQPSDDQQDGGFITLADGTALPYDWLVLALGADTNLGKILHRLFHVQRLLACGCLLQRVQTWTHLSTTC